MPNPLYKVRKARYSPPPPGPARKPFPPYQGHSCGGITGGLPHHSQIFAPPPLSPNPTDGRPTPPPNPQVPQKAHIRTLGSTSQHTSTPLMAHPLGKKNRSRQTPAWTRGVHLDAPGQRHGQQPRLRDGRPPE